MALVVYHQALAGDQAKPKAPVHSQIKHERSVTDPRVETVYLDEDRVAVLSISKMGTVISFPTKPSKVLLGRSGSFTIEYIESDLAITPGVAGATSNLFVYVLKRRFSFILREAPSGPSIFKIRDPKERPDQAKKGGDSG